MLNRISRSLHPSLHNLAHEEGSDTFYLASAFQRPPSVHITTMSFYAYRAPSHDIMSHSCEVGTYTAHV